MNNEHLSMILNKYRDNEISKDLAYQLIASYKKEQDSRTVFPSDDIAVIGIGCRFPGAKNKDEYWKNLVNGVDSVGPFPKSRRKLTDKYLDKVGMKYLSEDPYFYGGYLDEIDTFDNEVFGILAGEAFYIDPQQRIFMEVALEAFEDAGYGKSKIMNSNTGIYVGNTGNKYGYLIKGDIPSSTHGNWPAFVASRVSYCFNLSGPSMMVSVGCASSLLALHLACQALIVRDCDMALAGGITLDIFPVNSNNDFWNLLGIYTNEARCRAFDDSANGIAKGEGAGAVLLKPLQKAIEDGDYIYAVIKSSVTNQDGHSNGITAPNPIAQKNLLLKAWEKAGINPETIAYIETHGTGTRLGDPIEFNGLTQAFKQHTDKKHICAIGSSKTNIGHLADGGAGVAGFIKTVLSLHHEQIPPSLHFKQPNRLINFEDTAIYVNTILKPWRTEGIPRRAGVSAFGLVGTNIHMVLEETHDGYVKGESTGFDQLLCLSAKSDSLLTELVIRYIEYFKDHFNCFTIEDICYTANTSRISETHRLAVICSSEDDLIEKLNRIKKLGLEQGTEVIEGVYYSVVNEKGIRKVSLDNDDLQLAAKLYCEGTDIAWDDVYTDKKHKKVPLPTYVFDRKNFWVEDDTDFQFNEPIQTSRLEESFKKDEILQSRATEEELRGLWSEVLGIEEFDDNDDFFALGGDSLIAAQLSTALKKRFDVKISITEFLENCSFKNLTKIVAQPNNSQIRPAFEQTACLTVDSINLEVADFPLSFSQKRLWVMEHLQEDKVAYNVPGTFKFTGDFNVSAFKKAFEAVVNRHDSFKTSFISKDGEPRQIVSRELVFHLEIEDLSTNPTPEKYALEYSDRDAVQPFTLDKAPLIRAKLFCLDADKYMLCYTIHHIIFDGQSNRIFFDEVIMAYNAYNNGKEPCFKPLPAKYTDYACWQAGEEFQAQEEINRAFWLQKFQGSLPVTEIIGDKPRPRVFTFKGDVYRFTWDRELLDRFSMLCRSQGCTLYMGLLSLVSAFIYKYNRSTGIILGSPIAGRNQDNWKGIIGLFTNTIVLKVEIDDGKSFLDLLKEVQKTAVMAYQHEDYPFDRMVTELNLPKDTSRSPLFNINVALQNSFTKGGQRLELDDVLIEPVFSRHISSKWDLAFDFLEDKNGLTASIEYYSDLYSKEMIADMVSNFKVLLQSVLENPQRSIKEQNCLTGAFLDRILTIPEKVEFGGENNLVSWFARVVKEYLIRPAVQDMMSLLTFGELDKKSGQVAEFLKERSVGKGKYVAIYMENSVETVIAIWGILKTGAAYIPIDTSYPYNRIQSIIDNAGIEQILSKKQNIGSLNRLLWQCPSMISFLCLDSEDIMSEDEAEKNELMSEELWNYIGEEASDEVTGGGWVSSYTGENMTVEEMEEYRQNVISKLTPYLSKDTRVLEIGCASGITMFGIAPYVQYYCGTDISESIIAKNRARIARESIQNITLHKLAAHEIDNIHEEAFDIIIINSVIHCFNGHNYFNRVIGKMLQLLKSQGILFFGDIMDLDRKNDLILSLKEFKQEHAGKGYKTKTEWDTELFLSREYFYNTAARYKEIQGVDITQKIHSRQNELTRFRYDVICKVDKNSKNSIFSQTRYMYDRRILECYDGNLSSETVDPEDLAYVIYTSGSTGTPKGVMVSHDSVINYIRWAMSHYFPQNNQMFPFYSSLSFDLTVTSIFATLLSGNKLNIYGESFDKILNPMVMNKELNAVKITPSHLIYMINGALHPILFQKYILGGEALEKELLKELARVQENDFIIYNEYGPTEATVGCIVYEMGKEDILKDAEVYIGKQIANTHIYILDEDMKPVPVGSVGEIYISGRCLAKGYLGNPLLTQEKFIENPYSKVYPVMYKTGDLGRFLPEGHIQYFGRNDQQVKIRGYRIELEEIEMMLRRHPLISDCVAAVKRDYTDENALCGYYIANEQIAFDTLRKFMEKELPEYMIPSFFCKIDSIPVTVNGKVNRNVLPAITSLQQDSSTKYKAPTTEQEHLLVKAWMKVLGRNTVGINDSFFELGGDSIKAIQLVSGMYQFNYRLEVRDLFQYPTIEELAPRMEIITQIADQGRVFGEISLTPIQHYFFDNYKEDRHYYNQILLLKTEIILDALLLEKVFIMLMDHHDALRMVFSEEIRGKVMQFNTESTQGFELKVVDLTGSDDWNKELLKEAGELQKAVSLDRAPLLKAALFRTNDGDRLFISIHHLVVDGVSWRILLEDINTAYSQLQSEEEIKLPLKTSSYKVWSQDLQNYKKSAALLKEKPYWQSITASQYRNLPYDTESTENRVKDSCELGITLSEEITGQLVKAHHAYNTRTDDLLLTAIALTMREYHGMDKTKIALEGHGREQINTNNDISRTVGWFTSVYPAVLDLGGDNSIGLQIKSVKESLHNIPKNGFGFGILKYLTDAEFKGNIDFDFNPQIAYNNLGELETDFKAGIFRLAGESTGRSRSENLPRIYDIEFGINTINGRMNIWIDFNGNRFKKQTIQDMLRKIEFNLNRIMEHCIKRETSEVTPSDLTYKELAFSDLEDLFE